MLNGNEPANPFTYDATGYTAYYVNNPSANADNGIYGQKYNQFEGGAGDDTIIGNGNTRASYQHASEAGR
mgnify:CR=1 FL=1